MTKLNAELFYEFLDQMPSFDIKKEYLQKKLYYLGLPFDARKWAGLSVMSGIFSFLLLLILSSPIVAAFFSVFISFFVFYFPHMRCKSKEMKIEAEMPLFLRNLGVLVNMGIPFISAMEMLSREKGAVSFEIRRVLKEVKKGSSVSKTFSEIADNVESIQIKRGIAQIISSYEHGSKGHELKQLGNELLNVQRHKLREYAAKTSMFSLLFIMLSVVAPTFFIVLSIVEPLAFSQAFNEQRFSSFILVLFPVLSFFILLASKSFTPPSIFKEEHEPYYTLAIGIAVALLFLLDINLFLKMLVFVAMGALSFYYFFSEYKADKKREEVEKNLANALLVIASLPKGMNIEKVFGKVAESKLGEISGEFRKATNQIKANAPLDSAIEDMKARVKSRTLSRVLDVLMYSVKAGSNLSERIAEMAEDVLSFVEIKRERSAILAMQKYTLLLGVFLLAVVVSNAVSLSDRLSFISGVKISDFALKYVPSYIVITAALVSWFCASIEGSSTKSLVYFSAISILSLITFYSVLGAI